MMMPYDVIIRTIDLGGDKIARLGLMDIAREIDHRYTTTNSEWARIQLKIIEPYFDNVVEFEYHLNDWYLHLQIEIAFWLISQRS